MTRTLRSVVLLATLLMAACAPRVERPDIWLSGVRVVSLGIRGGVMDVTLGVYNPNRFVIQSQGLTYDLDFEAPGDQDRWLDFADGRVDELFRVTPGDTATVVIPVEFDYRDLGSAVQRLIERGSIEYRVSGVVVVEEPVERDLRYRHTGTVSPSGAR